MLGIDFSPGREINKKMMSFLVAGIVLPEPLAPPLRWPTSSIQIYERGAFFKRGYRQSECGLSPACKVLIGSVVSPNGERTDVEPG